MAITINREIVQGSDSLHTIMGRHMNEMNKSFTKISTGLEINHASDNAAGKAISERMLTQIRALDQSQENTQTANSMLKAADVAITSIVDVIKQMRTKAIEASTSVLNDDDRAALQSELEQLKDQVINTNAMVTHNGNQLLTGNYGTIEETIHYSSDDYETIMMENEYGEMAETPFTQLKDDADGKLEFTSFAWDKNGPSLNFQVGPDRNSTLTTHLRDMTSIFKGIDIDVSTVDNSAKLAKNLDKALTRALYQQTEIGSVQERLTFTSENLQLVSDNTQAALSEIQDADMAKEMTTYVKHNMLMQATQSMMAQANTTLMSFLDLIRPQ